jgi:uncharacterized membrane protein YdfJ with MMPL/SSD domain
VRHGTECSALVAELPEPAEDDDLAGDAGGAAGARRSRRCRRGSTSRMWGAILDRVLRRPVLSLVFGFVLGLAFLLLLLTFRSIVVPLKAIVLNPPPVAVAYAC